VFIKGNVCYTVQCTVRGTTAMLLNVCRQKQSHYVTRTKGKPILFSH